MTNEAIILIRQNENGSNPSDISPLSSVNNHPFLHYQLEFLANNLFELVVIIIDGDIEQYANIFGNEYLGIRIEYIKYDADLKSTGNITIALEHITQANTLILNGNSYFRLNLRKADDFRRMRDSRILMIGKQLEKTLSYEEIRLNEKGQIKEIAQIGKYRGPGAVNTGTFLINTRYFKNQFSEKKLDLYSDFFKTNYTEESLYCLACKQYYIEIHKQEDLEKAKNEFEEYYF